MASGGSLRNLIAEVQRKQRQLAAIAPEVATGMAVKLVEELNVRTPVQTGTMRRVLTETTTPYQRGPHWIVGVGNKLKIGSPEDQPPRLTITEFLRDHKGPYEAELIRQGTVEEKRRQDARNAEREQRADAKAQKDKDRKAKQEVKDRAEAQRALNRNDRRYDELTEAINVINTRLGYLEKRYNRLLGISNRLSGVYRMRGEEIVKRKKKEGMVAWKKRIEAARLRQNARLEKLEAMRETKAGYLKSRRELDDARKELEAEHKRLSAYLK